MSGAIKTIIFTLLMLTVFSIGVTYHKYFVVQDYEVEFEVDCDTGVESCFTWICDPEVDGEGSCTGDPEDDVWHYKLFYRNAMHVPPCEEEDGICVSYDLECSPNENCYEATCTDELATELGLGGCNL